MKDHPHPGGYKGGLRAGIKEKVGAWKARRQLRGKFKSIARSMKPNRGIIVYAPGKGKGGKDANIGWVYRKKRKFRRDPIYGATPLLKKGKLHRLSDAIEEYRKEAINA
jgi:hypothetical protein